MPARTLLVTLLVGLALAAPADAQTQYADPADGGLAPDIGLILADWTPGNALGFAIGVGQRGWYVGDRVFVYLDTDDNPATGDGGADYQLLYEVSATGTSRMLGRWVGAGYDYSAPQSTFLATPGAGQVVFAIDRSEIGFPSDRLRFWVYSVYRTGTSSPMDRAPNAGAYVLHQTAVGGVSGGPEPPVEAPAPSTAAPGAGAAAPAATAAPALARRPKLRGRARVGRRLRATRGRWSGASSVRYQWLRDGRAIRGARRSRYRLRRADRGHRIACRVVARGPGGRSSAITPQRRVR